MTRNLLHVEDSSVQVEPNCPVAKGLFFEVPRGETSAVAGKSANALAMTKYVQAARDDGPSHRKTIFSHMVSNAMEPPWLSILPDVEIMRTAPKLILMGDWLRHHLAPVGHTK